MLSSKDHLNIRLWSNYPCMLKTSDGGKITSSCSMGAIWRQAVCIVIVLLFLVGKKCLPEPDYLHKPRLAVIKKKKKMHLVKYCLLVKEVLTVCI